MGSTNTPARFKVALVNMVGERNPAIYEPIAIELLAARVKRRFPEADLLIYDTQPERACYGKIDTTNLAALIRKFGNDEEVPMLLGLSVPIYSYSYTKSLLLKLEKNPPLSSMRVVIGNTIPTYADPALLLREFPYITLVKGEGDEAILEIAQRVALRDPVNRIYARKSNLNGYEIPFRDETIGDIIALEGAILVEGSRGCGYGHCTFCSRLEMGGKDYRVVPEDKVVETIRELAYKYNVTTFGFTDEEAFVNIAATRKLVEAIANENFPILSFRASFRVDEFNNLEEEGLIKSLMGVGLDKVFLGVEGGSNEYLKLLGKGITAEEARRAIWTAKKYGLDYEIGFIMFSWRMTLDMLKSNIEFVSEGDNIFHISELLQNLMVRAGAADEKILKHYVENGKIDYNLEAGFTINDLMYHDVPFLDAEVGRIYQIVRKYEDAEANLHYALKSHERGVGNTINDRSVEALRRALIGLRMELLKCAAGIGDGTSHEWIIQKRRDLVLDFYESIESGRVIGSLEDVKREAKVFLGNKPESNKPHPDAAVSSIIRNEDGEILLRRLRLEDKFTFFGIDGVDSVEKGNNLRDPNAPQLQQLAVSTGTETYAWVSDSGNAVADVIWANPDDILSGRIDTKENVQEIVRSILRA